MDIQPIVLKRLKLLLDRNGQEFTFSRPALTAYKTPDLSKAKTSLVKRGIFHQSQSYVTVTSSPDAQVLKKQIPMIFGAYSELKDILKDDTVAIGSTTYKVNAVLDVSNMGIYADVSLEAVM